MTEEDADNLVAKVQEVLLSCKTMEQLDNAITYARLSYRYLAKHRWQTTKHIILIQQAVEYALCLTKNYNKEEV